MRHVFKCIHQGWDKRTEGIWFDAEDYTEDEARAQFLEIEQITEKNNESYPYTAYEYQGEVFYKVYYLGIFDDDKMPGMI